MLQNRLCRLLGIEFPVLQAGMSRFTSAELIAAASNAEEGLASSLSKPCRGSMPVPCRVLQSG
jgi:NAD(P)H-dependent flavin oxidoreductase YrpB (nitropropane dioxygenase family)